MPRPRSIFEGHDSKYTLCNSLVTLAILAIVSYVLKILTSGNKWVTLCFIHALRRELDSYSFFSLHFLYHFKLELTCGISFFLVEIMSIVSESGRCSPLGCLKPMVSMQGFWWPLEFEHLKNWGRWTQPILTTGAYFSSGMGGWFNHQPGYEGRGENQPPHRFGVGQWYIVEILPLLKGNVT